MCYKKKTREMYRKCSFDFQPIRFSLITNKINRILMPLTFFSHIYQKKKQNSRLEIIEKHRKYTHTLVKNKNNTVTKI